jgi:CheY-like chemotaxis protein
MKKLLIVDDEEAMRGLYRRRLSRLYELIETGDPEQALALALEHKPDAILLDLKMPKYDGFDLCRNFRTLGPTSQIPLIVITGQHGAHQEECAEIGVSGYFEKPIDFDQLKETLEETLKGNSPARPRGAELRVQVALKLKGKAEGGELFDDRAETESISADGFLCISPRILTDGSMLDVFLVGRTEVRVGIARTVERRSAGLDRHRYRFVFEGEKKNWILQRPAAIARSTQSS